MKQKLLYSICTLFGIFLTSCNPDDVVKLPEPTEETPLFSVKAQDLQVNRFHFLQAGVDDYYLYTYQETDQVGVANAIASLRKIDCDSECPISFDLRFSSDENRQAPHSDLVKAGQYRLRNTFTDEDLCQITVQNESTGTYDSFFWLFGDSASVFNQNTAINNYISGNEEDYFVRLTLRDEEGRTHSYSKKSSDIESFSVACSNLLTVVETSADSVWLTVDQTDLPGANSVSWLIESATDTTFVSADTIGLLRGEKFELFFEGANNTCTFTYSSYAFVEGNTLQYYIDFGSQTRCITNGSRFQLSRFELVFYDENGKAFSSQNYNNSSNLVTISQLEPFIQNENGAATQKATITASQIGLAAADGTEKVFKDFEANVAFSEQ